MRVCDGEIICPSYKIILYRIVFFRGVTWLRDSHGLFDYESRNITKKNIRTTVPGRVVRIDDEIEFFTPPPHHHSS